MSWGETAPEQLPIPEAGLWMVALGMVNVFVQPQDCPWSRVVALTRPW